jgi:pimeloyl-ACP methyl ester carboxylesterase
MTATTFVQPEISTIVRPYITARDAALRFSEPPAVVAPRVPEVAGYEVQRSTLRSGPHELAIFQWGSGGGPTALLAHGFGGSAAQMAAFAPGLLAAGYRVVAFDQPAHGFTAGRSAHLVDFAEHITRVARAFGVSAVIAHSLGATATLIAHARGLSLERAVLIAPPGNVEHFATAFADHVGLPREQLPALLVHVERELGYPLGLLDVRNLSGLTDGAPADLLVLHDPADAEVPYEHGRTLVAHWPGARLETLNGVGHRRVLRDAHAAALAVAHLAHHH